MTDAARVLTALADPTRRQVLEGLRAGPRSVSDLTAQLPVTQSAVSQHLRVLREAGLVSERRAGTRRLYRVELDGLSAVRAYIDGFWDDALEAFRRFADETDGTNGTNGPNGSNGSNEETT
ncbi:MAG: ArsR/SmtB family transcription factor [Actinomycetes bacterium]